MNEKQLLTDIFNLLNGEMTQNEFVTKYAHFFVSLDNFANSIIFADNHKELSIRANCIFWDGQQDDNKTR